MLFEKIEVLIVDMRKPNPLEISPSQQLQACRQITPGAETPIEGDASRVTKPSRTSFMLEEDEEDATWSQWLGKEAKPTWWQEPLRRMVSSWMFETMFAFAIFTNSIFIAVQVEMTATSPGQPPDGALFFIASVYTFVFTIEFCLRVAAFGPRVFCGEEWYWMLLDVAVVFSSLLEFALELPLHQEDSSSNAFSNMRLLRVLRVAKVTRALRIVRVVKFVRSLKSLLFCIGRTLRALAWSLVLLLLIIFVFGLIFTDITSEYLTQTETVVDAITAGTLRTRFGGLELSMHTLYASITGGFTWVEARDAFGEISFVWGILFEGYISFCLFAVLNVMTGVWHPVALDASCVLRAYFHFNETEQGQAIAFDLDDEEERDTFAPLFEWWAIVRGSDSEIISQAQMIAIGKQAGPAEQWLFPPVLDPVQGSGDNVTWYPIVRLIFRQPLPAAWASQQEILCGRISLQVAALSKDHLRDSQLGESGKTFLVDASGTILSAVHIQDTLAVDSVGAMQMRRLTDLPDASWSGSIAGAFRGDRIDAMQVQEGWLAVVVHPLPMPMNMFAIVVVSRAENSSFQDSSIFESMIVLMAFTSVPYVVVAVTLSAVFFSANTKVGAEMKARKSVFARFAGGVTDFAAASGIKMKHRATVRPTSRGSADGPLFTKEMEGMGRKISQTSVLSAGEIYDAEDKPLAVQPRKTHIMNDAYFEADRSCKGYCVRCVRCFCACCRGRARY
eukprot:s1084_g18.t1